MVEWEQYDKIDPIGAYREDLRISFLCSVITNIAMSFAGKKGSQKFSSAEDFLFKWDIGDVQAKPKQTLEQMKKMLHIIAGK